MKTEAPNTGPGGHLRALALAASLGGVFLLELALPDAVVEVDGLYVLVALCAIWFLGRRGGMVIAAAAVCLPILAAVLGEETYPTAIVQALAILVASMATELVISVRARRIRAETEAAIAAKKVESVRYLSHELRTPLAAVMGYASLLEDMPDLVAHKREIQSILQGADRLNAVVDEVLEVEPWWIDTTSPKDGGSQP